MPDRAETAKTGGMDSPRRGRRPLALALSVRQPWAGLLVAGLKSVEVRSWPVRYRGRLLIHAACRLAEEPESWQKVAEAAARYPGLWELCTLRGGIIGEAELVDCFRYVDAVRFVADQDRHLLPPCRFCPSLYGFLFRQPRPVVYHACRGRTFLFPVEGFRADEPHAEHTPPAD